MKKILCDFIFLIMMPIFLAGCAPGDTIVKIDTPDARIRR